MRTLYLLIVVRQQLEDRCLWLADRLVDRLVDNSLLLKSSNPYFVVAQHVVRPLEDMVEIFNYLIVYIQTICNPFH